MHYRNHNLLCFISAQFNNILVPVLATASKHISLPFFVFLLLLYLFLSFLVLTSTYLLIAVVEVILSHTHSIGPLWTKDRPVVEKKIVLI